MKIDYDEICDFYISICNMIFTEIDVFYPNTYEDMTVKYSDEYLKAYSYLQRAGWRLEQIKDMKQYYDEENFKYFGLENLYNVRNRIEHYLNDVEIEFSDSVYTYNQYDDIYSDFKKERLTTKASEKFAYYETKLLQRNEYDYVLNSLTLLNSDIKNIINSIKESKYVKNIHNKKLNKMNKLIKEITGDIKNDM